MISPALSCSIKALQIARSKLKAPWWRKFIPDYLAWGAIYVPSDKFISSMVADKGALEHLNGWHNKYSGYPFESNMAVADRVAKLDCLIKIVKGERQWN